MAEYKLTITIEAPPELTDADEILDHFVGESIDVGNYSVDIVRGISIEELPEGGAYR